MPEDTTTTASPSAPAPRREVLHVESFDPVTVRPWHYHNRAGSGMDDASLNALARSIKRDGQQQTGLARRLPDGDTHVAEAIFGVRRLEACRRAGVPWRAEVRDASFSDAQCAAFMYAENEWDEGVSHLENAVQWKAMLDAGVFISQAALATELGCHRGTVSRAIRTASALFREEWLARLIRPVMHEFSGRAADRIADAYARGTRRNAAMRRAKDLKPGQVPAERLHDALFTARKDPVRWDTVFTRHRVGPAGGGTVAVKMVRNDDGAWAVTVRPHEQSPAELAELAERVEQLIATETAAASDIRLGHRLTALLTPEEARDADRSWLEGLVFAAARASGLDWDRLQSAVAADALLAQRDGWERAVAEAVTRPQAAASDS